MNNYLLYKNELADYNLFLYLHFTCDTLYFLRRVGTSMSQALRALPVLLFRELT